MEAELTSMLNTHPRLRAQERSVASAIHAITESKSGYYPSVDGVADMGPEYIDNSTERSERDDAKEWLRTRNVATLTITQNLFDGYSTTSGVRAAIMNKAATDRNRENTTQSLLFDGISAYLNVLRNVRLVDLARQSTQNIKNQADLESARVEIGSGEQADELEIKKLLQETIELEILADFELQNALAKYEELFDHSPDVASMTDPELPIELLPESLEAALQIMVREHPELNNFRAQIESSRATIDTNKAEYYPSIDLTGKANYEKHKNGTIDTRRDYSLILSATWNFFNGFGSEARVNQAVMDHSSQQALLSDQVRQKVEGVKKSWESIVHREQLVENLENLVQISETMASNAEEMKEQEAETLKGVLEERKKHFENMIKLVAQRYDYQLAMYEMLKNVGRLTPENIGLNGG